MRCAHCDKEIGESKTCPYCGTYNNRSAEPSVSPVTNKFMKTKLLYIVCLLFFVFVIAFYFGKISSDNVDEIQEKYDKLYGKYNDLMDERNDLYSFYLSNKDNTSSVSDEYDALSESEKQILKKSGTLNDKYNQLEDDISSLKNSIDSLKSEKKDLKDKISSLKRKISILKKTDGIKKGSKKYISAGEYTVGDNFPEGRYKITSAGSSGNVISYDNYLDDLNIIISNRSDFGVKEYTHEFTTGERVIFDTSVYVQKIM